MSKNTDLLSTIAGIFAPQHESPFWTNKAMHMYGGGFVRALAIAAECADDVNLAKLQLAFPEYFAKSAAMGAELKRQDDAKDRAPRKCYGKIAVADMDLPAPLDDYPSEHEVDEMARLDAMRPRNPGTPWEI